MYIYPQLRRKAYLLSADRLNRPHFVNSTYADIVALSNFLKSPLGGAWKPDEIAIYRETNLRILDIIQSDTSDYCFVYFTGHGGMGLDGLRYAELVDRPVVYEDFNTRAFRQLLMVDACQNVVSTLGLSDQINESTQNLQFKGAHYLRSRNRFDEVVRNIPNGTVHVYATNSGQTALANSSGGYFTQSLIKNAIDWSLCSADPVLSIRKATDCGEEVMRQNFVTPQNPGIYHSNEALLSLPFAISISDLRRVNNSL